jgi:hypothetical protein
MFAAGAKVSARKVSGKTAVNIAPWTASTDFRRDPARMPNQIIAKPKSSRRAKPRTARPKPRWMRHPMSSPVTDMTRTPMLEWMRLEMLRPMRTDALEIGRDRNRSMMPLLRSLVRPIATTKQENVIVCAMIPGSSHSR